MSDYFARLRGRVDRRHLAGATIAVVGLGRVGAPIAVELARLVPHRLIFMDGDDYAIENCSAHPLPREFVGRNKASAMAEHLHREIPEIENTTAITFPVHPGRHELQLREELLIPASLVIVATDDLVAQHRIADIARRMDLPAIIPGLSEDGRRGEVFLSLSRDLPCLQCFDGYRPVDQPVRGAALAGPDAYPTVQLAFSLALAVLDGDSPEADLLQPLLEGGPPPQLFRAWPPGAPELGVPDDGRTNVAWRIGCEGCDGPPPETRATQIWRARNRAAVVRAEPNSGATATAGTTNADEFPLGEFVVGALVVEFILLLTSDWSAGVVAAFMGLSVGLVGGVWLGLFLAQRDDRG